MRACHRVLPFLLVMLALGARALAQDTTAPKVTDIDPLPGATLAAEPSSIVVTFDEPIDPATVSTSSFRLVRSGGDGTFADGNEVEIALSSVALTSATQATMDLAGAKLPNDDYRVRLRSGGDNYALRFADGDYVRAPDDPSLKPDLYITAEAWFQLDSGGDGNPRVLSKGYPYLELGTNGTGATRTVFGSVNIQGTGRVLLDSISTIGIGEWHHIAVTFDQTAVRLYLDGNFEAQTLANGPLAWTTNPFYIGIKGVNNNEWMNGRIDEVRVWDVARTESEIGDSMGVTLAGDESGLVAYWKLDEASGQTVADSSPSGNDGVLGTDTGVNGNDPMWVASTAPVLDGIRDVAGNVLDGEYSGSFPSGDDVAGGDFVSTFTIAAPLPKVNAITPAPGATVASEPASVTVTFTKEMDPATVNDASFRLVASGLDGTFGDGNEIEIAADSVALTLATRATMDLTTAVLPDDVYQVTVGGTPLPTAGLVAHWEFEEDGGATAVDSAGSNDGSIAGGPVWEAGQLGLALRFDGADDYVNVDSVAPSLTGDFTFCAWAKAPPIYTGTNYGAILGVNTSIGWNVMVLAFGCGASGYDNELAVYDEGSSGWECLTGTTFADGTWHHVTYVLSGTTGTIYVDGEAEATHTLNSSLAASHRWSLGQEWDDASPSDFLEGWIDDARLYSRALSDTEIQRLASWADVTDLASNILDGEYLGGFPSGDGTAGGDFVTTFTVEEDAPSVIATSPTDNATEVDVTSSIVVTFSELMNQGTTDGAFSILTAVVGVKSWLGNVLTFTPSADLSSDTTYTVTITTDATDLAGGRNLDQECQFTFTTVDTVPPTVDDIRADGAPLPGATLGASPSSIVVTFNEAIDPATVSADTFKLVASGGDGTFGDGDEIEIALDSVTPTSATVVTMDLGATELGDEEYQVTVVGAGFDPGFALQFDGGNDKVLRQVPDLLPPWTAEFWVRRLDSPAPAAKLMDCIEFGSGYSIRVEQWQHTNKVGFNPDNRTFNYEAPVGTWVHLAFVGTTTDTSLFVNGVLTDTQPYAGAIPGEAIGTSTTNDTLLGTLDEVRLWGVARTGAEIEATMRQQLSGSEAGLVGHYSFDEGMGQIAVDASPSANDGQLGDTPGSDLADPSWVVSTVPTGPHVTDLAGNVLDGEYHIATFPPSGDGTLGGDFLITFTVDKPPRVESITLLDSSPTGAGTVDFAVAFDQSVTGLATTDFAIDGSGVTGTAAAVSGSGTSYTVTVTSVAGDGTLSIDLIDDDSIIDGSGIPLGGTNPGNGDFTAGEAYDIDQTPPSVLSIALADADPTGADTVSFTVTFSEAVTGVLFTEFALATSGTSGFIFSSAPVSPDVYTITVINVTGDGTLGLDLVDDDGIKDLAGNPLGGAGAGNGSFTGDTYTIDNIAPDAPIVTGVASPTADDTPTWDWVQGGSPGDGTFRYQLDGELGAWTVTAALTYTPASALGDGGHVLYVQERDAVFNWSSSGSYGVTIDATPPVVTVDSLVTNDVSPALFGTVNDPTATIDVTVDGNSYAATNNGATWTLADNTISPALVEATYDVQVAATDLLGNSDTDGTTNELVIDLTPPTVTVDALLTNDDTPALTGTVDDPAAEVVVIVASQTNTATNNGDGTWTLADDTLIALGEGTFDVQAEATDAVGNVAYDATLDELVVDQTGPRVADINPAPGETLTAEPTSIVVTFDEPLDPATGSQDTFRLVASGGDGTFADGNEIEIVADSVALTLATRATMDLTTAVLPDDVYEVTVAASGGRGALDFDGTDDFVTCPQWLQGSGNQVTFEVWCRPLANGFGNMVLHRADFNDIYFTWATASQTFQFAIPLDEKALYSGPELVLGRWYHVAGTYDGSAVKLYINGELKDTHSVSKSINFNSGYFGSYIGGSGYSAWGGKFPGELDEVRVWTVARTQAELRASMYERLSGTETGLVGYYRFEELTGQTAFDLSPAGNDGQLGPTNGTDADDPTWVVSTTPLDAGVADHAGNALDGEYLGSLPSGDGTPGGDFACTFTIDTTPPVVTVDSLVTNDVTPALFGTVNDPTATIDVTVDGSSYAATNNADGTWALADDTITPGLAEGTYDVQAAATDLAGNSDTDGTIDELGIDLTSPGAPVVAGPSPTTDTTPTWTWTPGGGGSGQYRYGFTEGPWLAEDVTDTDYTPLAPLPLGPRILYVQERDDAGNWSASGSLTILVVEPAPPPVDPGKTPFGGGCAPGSGAGSVAWLAPLVLALLSLRRRGPART